MTMPKKQYMIAGVLAIPLLALALFAAHMTSDMTADLASHVVGRESMTVPAGTAIHVRLDHSLATNQNDSGETFAATVTSPVVVNGKEVIPAGARAEGVVVTSKPSGRLKGHAYMTLALNSVNVNGASYEVQTSTVSRQSGDHKKRNIALIGGVLAHIAVFTDLAAPIPAVDVDVGIAGIATVEVDVQRAGRDASSP